MHDNLILVLGLIYTSRVEKSRGLRVTNLVDKIPAFYFVFNKLDTNARTRFCVEKSDPACIENTKYGNTGWFLLS